MLVVRGGRRSREGDRTRAEYWKEPVYDMEYIQHHDIH